MQGLIRLLRVQPEPESTQLTPEELRVLVLESGQFIAKKHRSMLLNLFELENCTVDDVMVPRHQLEMIDIDDDLDEIVAQLRTCHHTRLPVCEGSSENVIGILHVRKVLHLMDRDFGQDALRGILRAPYFIPEGTPLFTQLQNFQENHRRIGIVVDEYGEMLGLVTLEDILEQVVGEFTTLPRPSSRACCRRRMVRSWLTVPCCCATSTAAWTSTCRWKAPKRSMACCSNISRIFPSPAPASSCTSACLKCCNRGSAASGVSVSFRCSGTPGSGMDDSAPVMVGCMSLLLPVRSFY